MKQILTISLAFIMFGSAQAQIGYSTSNKNDIKIFEMAMNAHHVDRENNTGIPNFQARIDYIE